MGCHRQLCVAFRRPRTSEQGATYGVVYADDKMQQKKTDLIRLPRVQNLLGGEMLGGITQCMAIVGATADSIRLSPACWEAHRLTAGRPARLGGSYMPRIGLSRTSGRNFMAGPPGKASAGLDTGVCAVPCRTGRIGHGRVGASTAVIRIPREESGWIGPYDIL